MMSSNALTKLLAMGSIVGILGVFLSARGIASMEATDLAELQRSWQLDEELVECNDRLERKEEILQELIAGHQSLLQTAQAIRTLYGDQSVVLTGCREAFPGHSDTEILCRHTIVFVSSRLSHLDSTTRDGVLKRLQQEFTELYPAAPAPVLDWDTYLHSSCSPPVGHGRI
jgi:hypothetical protein